MPDQQLSLSEYLETVQEIVKIAFGDPVWVKAEIRSLNTKSGHCYLELAEKKRALIKSLHLVKEPFGSPLQLSFCTSFRTKVEWSCQRT